MSFVQKEINTEIWNEFKKTIQTHSKYRLDSAIEEALQDWIKKTKSSA